MFEKVMRILIPVHLFRACSYENSGTGLGFNSDE